MTTSGIRFGFGLPNGRFDFCAVCVAALMLTTVAGAQTTNYWLAYPPSSGNSNWNTTANWDTSIVPNGNDQWAGFVGDFTNSPSVTLSSSVTLAGMQYADTSYASPYYLYVRQTGNSTITWDGGLAGMARISNTNNGNANVEIVQGVTNVIGANGLVKDGAATVRLGTVAGSGDILVSQGTVELFGSNPGYTGTIVATNGAGIQFRGVSTFKGGDTNNPTIIYMNSQALMRDYVNGTGANALNEPIVLRGMNENGSFFMYASSNGHYSGVVTLETNGVISGGPWAQFRNGGFQWNTFFEGAVIDDGNNRNLHLVNNQNGTVNDSGGIYRLYNMIFSGTASHGGYTHLSANEDPDTLGPNDMYLQLTNGNDRLPIATTLYLGGRMTDGINVGRVGASGILILGGVSQELAGLYVTPGGTGKVNRVVGGSDVAATLALNIASGSTNVYSGHLGSDNPIAGIGTYTNVTEYFVTNSMANQNNLNLIKKGAGRLQLSAVSNTYAGTTTVEAGTLLITGNHPGGGAMAVSNGAMLVLNGDWRNGGLITVANGGTLGGTGFVGSILSSGTVSPGNSPGTLTSYGNVTLGAGATLALELDDSLLGYESDRLAMNGGALSLAGGPDLSLTLLYTPTLGDAFTIVSGMTGFDPGFDGTFSGKPDLGTFDVSGTTFQIDYSATDITLTVVPEPHTLGLLGLAALGGLLRRRVRR
jgi:autotransporter-associated beta strand protein